MIFIQTMDDEFIQASRINEVGQVISTEDGELVRKVCMTNKTTHFISSDEWNMFVAHDRRQSIQ